MIRDLTTEEKSERIDHHVSGDAVENENEAFVHQMDLVSIEKG